MSVATEIELVDFFFLKHLSSLRKFVCLELYFLSQDFIDRLFEKVFQKKNK